MNQKSIVQSGKPKGLWDYKYVKMVSIMVILFRVTDCNSLDEVVGVGWCALHELPIALIMVNIMGKQVHYILYLASPVYLSCSTLILNRPCSVTNTKCKTWLYLSFLVKEPFGQIIILQCCNYCHLISDISSNFQLM